MSTTNFDSHLYVKLLHPEAKVPCKAHSGDSGFDIHYCGDKSITVYPGSRAAIPTKLAMTTDPGYFIKLESRSGSAFKNGVTLLCGVGDIGYREEYMVSVFNSDDEMPFVINPGERFAQITIQKRPEVAVMVVDELPNSGCERNGGLGSSGK